jgi:hypothetical protein
MGIGGSREMRMILEGFEVIMLLLMIWIMIRHSGFKCSCTGSDNA